MIVYLIFGMLLVILSWYLIPAIIRKSTTTFHPASYFPISGRFEHKKYDYDPLDQKYKFDVARPSKLTLEQYEVQGDKNHYLMMTYFTNGERKPIKILFMIEEWRQLFMRESDKKYRHNIALRAEMFIDETGKEIKFQSRCRVVGKNYSFGPAFGRRLATNADCENLNQPVSMVGYMSRSGIVLCIDLRIQTQDNIYYIEHIPQAMECLHKRVDP